jgi:hypothetical protein
VNEKPKLLDSALLPKLDKARSVTWLSPLKFESYAEYRDGDFLERIGHPELIDALKTFWPTRGPQWDALARTDDGQVLLVEAKAHIPEMCSPPTQASPISREKIELALNSAVLAAHAKPRAPWTNLFYQLGNRLAHLHFLRSNGVPAWLVLINFIGDTDMDGPSTEVEWEAAYKIAYHVMGVTPQTGLMKHVIHISPDVHQLG